MEKFIEYKKMSKKEKKKINAQKRVAWECSPLQKVIPNKKKDMHWSKSNAFCY